MTAYKKLGTLVAAALVVLAVGSGAATAGQKSWHGKSQSQEWQYRHGQDGGHWKHAHRKGHAFGRDARRHQYSQGYSWRPRAYGYRGRNNHLYGNGYRFQPNYGDHRTKAYSRKHRRVHRDYRYWQRWRGDSRFPFGRHYSQTDRRKSHGGFAGSQSFDRGGSCYFKTRKQTVDGQKRLIHKQVCRRADGTIYTVPGSRVVQLLD